MSRATVRAAVQSYLSTAGITNLSNVYSFPAKLTPEGEFYSGEDPGHSSGAVIFLYIENQHENRIEFRGASGTGKMVTYTFVLDCFLRSTHPKSQDAGADNDAFLDSLVASIRAVFSPQAGVVFSWGEGGHGSPYQQDIDVTSYYPKQLSGGASVTQCYSTVRVTVLEQLTA